MTHNSTAHAQTTDQPATGLVEVLTHEPTSKWEKPTQTLVIHGRARHTTGPVSTVTIRERNSYREPLLVLRGATIEQDTDRFRIGSRHMNATDVEHDSAYVALLEGAGRLSFESMLGTTMRFSGVLLSAEYYTTDPLADPGHATARHGGFCDDDHCAESDAAGHPFLPFTPPTQPWKAALYDIEVSFAAPS